MPTIKQIIQILENFAPINLAEPWDKNGLQVGEVNAEVKSILVGLDPTLSLIEKAKKLKADLIITHHPFLMEPLSTVNGVAAKRLKVLLENNIALYNAHTNLDVTPGGVNDVLASKLGLADPQVLIPSYVEQLNKLTVFVPQGHLEQVRVAICNSGAGLIGKYDQCTFLSSGIGTFRPLKGANPYTGKRGNIERVGEARLESLVPESKLANVIAAMLKAHPYEEVAYDIYPLKNAGRILGFGRYAMINKSMTLQNFAKFIKTRLRSKEISIVGNLKKKIKKVAVFSGSFSMSLDQAVKLGIDLLVAGEVKYSKRLEAQELGIALVIAGHYETEAVIIPTLVKLLKDNFKVKVTSG